MNKKITKRLLSGTIALALTCTNVVAQAHEFDNKPCYEKHHNVINSDNLTMNDYANNIITIYTKLYPEYSNIINDIVDTTLANKEFINSFEKNGSECFAYLELLIQEILDPSVSVAEQTYDEYISTYSIPIIKQNNYSSYSDCAIASLVMALYGCGVYSYSSDKNTNSKQETIKSQITTDSNGKSKFVEITKILNKNNSSNSNYSYQTKCFSGSNYTALNAIADSLVNDKNPIIYVEDTSKISYYKGISKSQYMVVKSIDFNAETITLIDANPSYYGYHTLSYDEFYNIVNESGKVFWASVYAYNNSNTKVNSFKNMYPNNSYYTNNGSTCYCNTGTISSNCRYYDGGWQCSAFARELYHTVNNRLFTSSRNTTLTTVHKQITDVTTIKKYLYGLPTGAHVRVSTKDDFNPDKELNGHSIAVISTDNNGINLAQANYGSQRCKVSYVYYSWSEFIKKFPILYYYAD